MTSSRLCEAMNFWGNEPMQGELASEDLTHCPNDAVGMFRLEGRHGGESVDWLCEEHRSQWEEGILEEVSERGR